MDVPEVTAAGAQLILTNAPPPTHTPARCTDTGPSLIEPEQHCPATVTALVVVGLSWAQQAELQDLLGTWD